ncbi:DUF3108 domain-containing protein [Rhodospirillaceae bacterium KN72]|uniref:DUF3108 domain-containing protein n=1 Tax=Pacificispira spongiicola TaxID=2729598 RepID=A0A7Y0E3L2_9PROT|nr:DUF3108 domain-containing protein [Pacificispira spongiicola]NMM46518.1 DUF3108 domain-containing protein [Pacificispira spongiicola]
MLRYSDRHNPHYRRFALVFGLVGFFVAVSGEGAVAASSETSGPTYDLSLRYEAYYSGFHVASGTAFIQRAPESYTVKSSAEARGIFDWFTGWRGQARSEGAVDATGFFRPVRHNNSGVWRGTERSTDLGFRPDGTIRVQRTAPPEPDEVTPIPIGMIDGSVDPISVALSLSETLSTGGDCKGAFPIFDGSRRYDVAVEPEAAQFFKESSYSIFAGEAVGCRLSVDRIGGFRTDPSIKTEPEAGESEPDRVVWVGRPSPGFPPVPVRVEVQTKSGRILLHLTEARMGEETISLYDEGE